MKKKILTALICVALFIPTVIAVVNYSMAQNSPVSAKTVSKIELYGLDERVYVFDRQKNDGKEMIDFLVSVNEKADEVAALPDQLKDAPHFRAKYYSYDMEKDYKYYFSLNSAEAFLINPDGKTYKINETQAQSFISSRYAETMYSNSAEPTLTLADGRVIEPESVEWYYKTKSGDYLKSTASGSVAGIGDDIEISGGISLSFDIEPDYLSIKIIKGADVLYDGLYEAMGDILSDINSAVRAEVTAKWYENETRGNNGESSYLFSAVVSAAPAFYLGETQIEQGDFVVITGKNVKDASKVEFSSTPSINFTPVFFKDGDLVRALVPISLDLTETGDYVFTLKSQGISQEMTLNVTGRGVKASIYYNISAEITNKTRTEATISAFNSAMASTASRQETTRYFDGVFSEATVKKSILIGFGRVRVISSTGEKYTHVGVDYIVNKGDSVVAANSGKVIYVGEQVLSGKLVVIDHGFGLKSWYAHMGDIDVAEGDIVKTGDKIGTVGSGGFTNSYNCHYSLTVFDVPVCPYPLWEDGVVMFTP